MKIKIRRSKLSAINCVYIFDCSIPNEDTNSIMRLEDDLYALLAVIAKNNEDLHNLKRTIKTIPISEYSDFLHARENIISEGKRSLINPLLMIYGHGDDKKGLMLPSKNTIGWDELDSFFSEIMEVAKGDLTVVAAFCHSYELVNKYEQKLSQKLPFSFYYGYKGEVSFGNAESDVYLLVKSGILQGGKGFEITNTNFSTFSEYDYIMSILAVTIMLVKEPEKIHEHNPFLSGVISRRNLRNELISTSDYPAGEIRKHFNKCVRSFSLIENIICYYMHATSRRDLLLEDLKKYFK